VAINGIEINIMDISKGFQIEDPGILIDLVLKSICESGKDKKF
jgi:hypothetical protein